MGFSHICLGFALNQVAYAAKDLKADFVVDMATVTGAQGVATGCRGAPEPNLRVPAGTGTF